MEKTIGTYEDLQHDQVIAFIFSDETVSRIVRYKVGDPTVSLVFEWDGFGWAEDTLITGVGMVGDILIWCEGLEREIRAINITKGELYNSVKNTDTRFINLIKRPPLTPLTASRVDLNNSKPNLILDHSFVFSYRYVYEDDEVSVFAPWSEPVYLPYNGEGQDDFKDITITQGLPSEAIPPLVKKIEFLVKRDTETVWYSIKSTVVTPNTTVSQYSFNFDNSFLGSAINEDDSVRLFDAIWPAKSLTVARNRVFIGNYAEGYDEQGDADMTITLNTAAPAAGQRVFKSNSSVRFSIAYYDAEGRTMGALPPKPEWSVSVPPTLHKTTDTNYTTASVSITLDPPEWAKAWRLVRSPERIYSFFIQGFGYAVMEQEVSPNGTEGLVLFQRRAIYDVPDVNGNPSTLAPAVLKGLFIDISSLTDRNIGYSFEEGDSMNLYYTILPAEGGVQDMYLSGIKILEQRGSLLRIADIPLITKAKFSTLGGGKPYYSYIRGTRFEIYRESTVSLNLFLETPIGGNLSEGLSATKTFYGSAWLIPSTAINSKNYDSYSFDGQDEEIEWTDSEGGEGNQEQVGVYYPWMEAMSPWDRYYTQWLQGLGRTSPVLSDNLRKRVYKPTYERFSNKYLPGTQINGISSFEGLNEKDLPLENGEINKLALVSNNQSEGTVLLAVMQNESESQYLGETQFKDTQGQTVGAITDSVIGSTNTLRGGYGTINPESFVYKDGRAYWWDATKGEVARYSNDGLTPLARLHKMQNFFREVSRKQLELENQGYKVNVFGGYDPEMDEAIFTFSEIKEGEVVLFEGFTVAYSEKIQGFSTFYSFKPEFYCKSNTRFVSFLDGKLYLHGDNPVHNNFYGVQYTSTVKFLSNQNPHLVKIWNSIAIEGEEVWVPKEIANDKGQLSYMKKQWFDNREGIFYGAIRRDVNTFGYEDERIALNNGDVLRSQVLEVTIENDSTSEARLDVVNILYIESSGHTTIN